MTGPKKTLERVISKAGLGSRTQARSWIHARRVTVNGEIVENPDHWVDFKRDRVQFDGKPLRPLDRVYILLHKPAGYITTLKDPENRPTVYDLIEGVDTFVAPVGRLDLDSSGLLLLTNDTQLAERLTNPNHSIPKTYLVTCAGVLDQEALQQLMQGVELSDGLTRPADVDRIRDTAGSSQIAITLTEGRNRQIRRMVEAVGSKVTELVRTSIGPISLDGLASGTWRELSPGELRALRE